VTEAPPIGVLVMAYGTAAGPDDIERYYTDIRGGRPPTPEHLQELKDRYEAIGNVFPLGETTVAQADGIVERLNADADGSTYRAYLGMKHSPPFIPDGVERMRDEGVERGIGIVMAPHWSGMSVETYVQRVQQAVEDHGETPRFTFVRSYHDHPAFISFLTERVREGLEELPDDVRDGTAVIFSAHSLPVRTLDDGSQRLAPAVVRNAEDSGVDDVGMGEQRGLDLGRIHVDPARDHHVGAPVGDEEVAVGIEPAHVADGEDVAAEGRRGLLGRVAIRELPAAG